MIGFLGYVFVAVAAVILAGLLLRQRENNEDVLALDIEEDYAQGLWDGPGLTLAERIFDSDDYLWLRDDIRCPGLAHVLAQCRKEMALRWLKGLGRSFDQLIRVPQPTVALTDADQIPTWQLLWLTVRFHFLLNYAILAVRAFGPYHRLVPSFGWLPAAPESLQPKPDYRSAGIGNSF